MRKVDVHSMSNPNLIGLGERLIENAQASPFISSRLEEVGIGAEHFESGARIVATFRPLVSAVPDLAGRTTTKIDERNEALTAFRDGPLRRYVMTARNLFRDRPGVAERLQLSRILFPSQSVDEFLEAGRTFFTHLAADDALMTQMTRHGFSPEDHARGRATIDAIARLNQEYSRLVAQRQQAVRSRDDYRPVLLQWIRETQEWARIALSDRPDLLEQLGFVVPSN
jgi:hypothetical protein